MLPRLPVPKLVLLGSGAMNFTKSSFSFFFYSSFVPYMCSSINFVISPNALQFSYSVFTV